jgi:hypothetical protein
MNHTVFAPSNAALGSANLANANIADILAYHVTASPIDIATLNTSDTFVRTTLGTRPSVLLRESMISFLRRWMLV